MALDPDMAAQLQLLKDLQIRQVSDYDVPAARAVLRAIGGVDTVDPTTRQPVGSVDDAEIAGSIPVRVYRPDTTDPVPTVVYLHGGGWVLGDLDTHDGPARRVCAELPAVVVSVAYRLAPEHRYPAAVEDAYAALAWVVEHVADYGGDADRIVIGGDSSGANLAAVCARRARDAGLPLAAQMLVYPSTDVGGSHDSVRQNGEGYFLTRADISWFFELYTGAQLGSAEAEAFTAQPDLAPLRAKDLGGLAPAILATAEFDPLRDEGDRYAEALEAAGVQVAHRRFDGLIHGFFGNPAPRADEATTWIIDRVRQVVGKA